MCGIFLEAGNCGASDLKNTYNMNQLQRAAGLTHTIDNVAYCKSAQRPKPEQINAPHEWLPLI